MNFRNTAGVSSRKEELRVEITPLIDVVFLLLIFFTITTTFVTTPGFRVKLPKAGASSVQKSDHDATVVITADGRTILDNKAVDEVGLADELARLAAEAPDTLLIVQADESVPHGKVVQVMDIAKEKGIRRLAIATRAAE